MRLLRTVGRPELIGPVTQRNLGVWLGLTLIAVIVGLDMVGGGNAELLGLLVSPPIVGRLVCGSQTHGRGRAGRVGRRGRRMAGRSGWTCWPAPRGTRGHDRGRDGAVGAGGAGAGRAGGAAAGGRPGRRVAQRALLGGVPPALGSCAWPCCMPRPAPRRRSGDFYEALETPHGVRLLVGDVRGKGLDAVRLAGVVLGSFRDAAQDRPDLAQVTAALDRSVTRAIGPEDFVTAVLVQVDTDGSAIVVNCGHPRAAAGHAGQATELDPPEPAPPLGLGPRPEPLRLTLALGDRILLYTDGASEARARGGSSRCRPRRRSRWSAPTWKPGWRRSGPSCNAMSLGSSTTTSPCCSSNTAADSTPTSPQADGSGQAAQLGCRPAVQARDQAGDVIGHAAWQARASVSVMSRGARRHGGIARRRSRSRPPSPSSGNNSSQPPAGGTGPCGTGVVAGDAAEQDPFVEQGAGLLHRDQDLIVAAHPGQVLGPAATFHVKAAVLAPELLDDVGEPVRAVAGCHAARCGAGTAAGSPAGRLAGCRWRTAAPGIR